MNCDAQLIEKVQPIAQSKQNSCLFAAAAMLLTWKNKQSVTEVDVAKQAGPPFDIYFDTDTGVPAGEIGKFAIAVGLTPEPIANYSVDAWARMINQHGPLMVGVDVGTIGNANHIVVVTGMAGDCDDSNQVTGIDPETGAEKTGTFKVFNRAFEAVAGTNNLRHVILHF